MGLLSKSAIAGFNKGAEERGTKSRRPNGVYEMVYTDVVGSTSKKGHPMVTLTLEDVNTDSGYWEQKEWFTLTNEISMQILAARFQAAGFDGIPEKVADLETAEEIGKVLHKTLLNKKVKVAVGSRMSLYQDENGQLSTTEQSQIAYTGNIEKELAFRPKVTPLSEADQAKFEEYQRAVKGKSGQNVTEDDTDEELDDFEDPAPAKKPAKATAKKVEPEPEIDELEEEEEEEEEPAKPAPKKKGRPAGAKKEKPAVVEDEDLEDEELEETSAASDADGLNFE